MIPIQRPQIGLDELDAVKGVFDSRWLGMGREVRSFEQALGSFLNNPNIVTTNTGTTALHLALASCSFEAGSEVIVPSLTFIASIQAILAAGLQPVFADIDPRNCNVDPDSIRRCLTDRTRAIMPVHYRGEPCDMDAILDIANENNLVVIEDAAHAFGTHYGDRKLGSLGDITCFSFDPIKNITSGEGGAIAFSDAYTGHYDRALKIRNLGIDSDGWDRVQRTNGWTYDVSMAGFRYHMPNFCAAIGLNQLEQAEAFRARKVEICQRYDEAVHAIPGLSVIPADYGKTFPFMYVIRAGDRNGLLEHLRANDIGCGVHYRPAHGMSLCRNFPRDDLGHTEKAAAEILTLPLFTELPDEDVEKIIDALRSF